ncbi:MAG: response regulator, partial [Gemmatimonadota bacterium]|nr:response regulator [Gemmatimonadota bacterium]
MPFLSHGSIAHVAIMASLAAAVLLAWWWARAAVRAAAARSARVTADLAAAEDRYRQFFTDTPVALYRTSPEGRILEANKALAAMLGYATPEEAIGVNATDHHVERSQRDTFRVVLDGARAVRMRNVLLRRRDGSTFWAVDTSAAVRGGDGRVRHYEGSLVDASDQRASEERLVQAERIEAVGRLAGGIAHEYNNILTVVVATAELLAAEIPPGTEQAEMVGDIRQAGANAAALTRQLLLLSRREVASPTALPFDVVVMEAASMLRRVLGAEIRLTVDAEAGGSWVRMDRGHLEQMLSDLATHARAGMPSGGTLTVRTARVRDGVELVVTDTGLGLSAEALDHVFEPFFPARSGSRGMGLGYATCHAIVTQAGGEIAVQSAPGAGTTVRIVLPLTDPPAPARPAWVAPGGGGESVLLVEDDEAVRQVTVRVLTGLGYKVVAAADAESALETLGGRPGTFDLLFSDVVLPGMGGRELAEAARRAQPGLKVLFTSGYTNDVILQRQLLDRDAEVLPKPFTPDELASKVRAVGAAPPPPP